ncbi:hypothetical protein GCM10027020_18990 [Nocardioides salsibiostraticola]
MTQLLSTTTAVGPGDADLISAVRAGDVVAYGVLFERHVGAARRLAAHLAAPSETDDLVSDAFAKVLDVLQRGGGPDLAFRAYLLTSLRRLHIDRLRALNRTRPVEDLTAFDTGVPFEDPAVAEFENTAAAEAFASLPERWQMVLWHTEVEQLRPQQIAPLLGVSANSVAALAYRAREGLRQAYVSMHANSCSDQECTRVRRTLGSFIRRGTSRRDTAVAEAHLARCPPCAAIHAELLEVNSRLGAWLAPALLGVAGHGYLVTPGSLTGLSVAGLALTGRVKDAVARPAAAAGSVLVAAAAAASLGFALIGTPFTDDGSNATKGGPSTSESGAGSNGTRAPTEPADGVDPEDAAVSEASEQVPPTDVDDPARLTLDFQSPPATDGAAFPTNTAISGPAFPNPIEVIPDTGPAGPTTTDASGDPTTGASAAPDPVDISLRASRGPSTLTTQGVRLDVVGLPRGRTATLVITEEVGRGRQVVSDGRCEPTSAGAKCSVSSQPDPFHVTLSRTECSTYFVQVLLDEGTDPSPDNNSTRVKLGDPAIACLTTGLLDVTLKGERRASVRP